MAHMTQAQMVTAVASIIDDATESYATDIQTQLQWAMNKVAVIRPWPILNDLIADIIVTDETVAYTLPSTLSTVRSIRYVRTNTTDTTDGTGYYLGYLDSDVFND